MTDIAQKSITIFGGGLSGLTAAHELINKGFKVVLVEKDSVLGGMAKTRREINDIPSEHSWRGFAPFYKNTYEIMQEIPIDKSTTVYDTLSTPIDFLIVRDRITSYKPRLNMFDYIFLSYYGAKHLFANKRRQEYYKTKLLPFVKDKLSRDGFDFLVEFILGPGYGMEKKDASVGHFYKFSILNFLNQQKYTHVHNRGTKDEYIHQAKDGWHVTTMPTHEAWINPWKNYLEAKGLKIYLNTELVKFNIKDGKIVSCLVSNRSVGPLLETLVADDYLLCINPFDAEKVFKRSGMTSLYNQFQKMNEKTVSKQISFRIGFDKPIKFSADNVAFVMADSEYNITWYPQERHWSKDTKLEKYDQIKSLWSGTILNAYSVSKYFGKPGLELNKDQLVDDIIKQILRSKSLQKYIYENNGFFLKGKDVVYKEVWYEWSFNKAIDSLSQGLDQDHQKWVNNIYNEEFRPFSKTEYGNLFLGGAHTKTTIGIWSMEGAVESGRIAADNVLEKYGLKGTGRTEHKDPLFFRIFQGVDDVFYSTGLPNIFDVFIFVFVVILIVLICLIALKYLVNKQK